MKRVLLGDIGGTHTRFAVFDGEKTGEITVYRNREILSFEEAFEKFIRKEGPVAGAVLGVAGTVKDGCVQTTNFNWILDQDQLAKRFSLDKVVIVNDFVAQGYGVLSLKDEDKMHLGGKQPVLGAPVCVLGPGTGLGVCFLLEKDGVYDVISSEGGHVCLPLTRDMQDPLFNRAIHFLWEKFPSLSAERLVSGGGLHALYEALYRAEKHQKPDFVFSPPDIMALAQKGDKTALEAYRYFFRFLGAFAGDMALTVLSAGGVYLTGGILNQPFIGELLKASDFRASFEEKGRLKEWIKDVPVYVVLHPSPAFFGLERLALKLF